MNKALFMGVFLILCSCSEPKSTEDINLENNLCIFNESIIIGHASKNGVNIISCLTSGVAKKTYISDDLSIYIKDVYSDGDTIRCEMGYKKENTLRVPLLESKTQSK